MYEAGDDRIEDVPDPSIVDPTDAVLRVTRACICGSDLWPYRSLEPRETGRAMGHEAIGVVEEVGSDVHTLKHGDLVVMPFAFSDGTCAFCRERLHTARMHGGFFDDYGISAAQAEAVRVPYADGTLYPLPVGEDDALMPSLLLECVGHGEAMETATRIARPGGAVGRVGVPQHTEMPGSLPAFFGNITVGGGPAPVRAYLDELLPDVLEGRIEPGRVFDRDVGPDGVPDGYRAMAERESIKVMIEP
jgi:threonine dehydrogenase-like Zn-dependent dehydrogenase